MSFQTPSKVKQCSKSCSKSFTTPGKKAGVALLFAAGCVVDQSAAFTSRSVSSASFSRCRKHKLPSSIRKMQSSHEYEYEYEGEGEGEMIASYFFSGAADDNIVDDSAVRRLDMEDTNDDDDDVDDIIGYFSLSVEPAADETKLGRLERIFQQASALVDEEESLPSFSVPVVDEESETNITSANPDIPFHFSRSASLFERVDRLRDIYNNDPAYIGTPAMATGVDSWQ
jgi:hypothetical protein